MPGFLSLDAILLHPKTKGITVSSQIAVTAPKAAVATAPPLAVFDAVVSKDIVVVLWFIGDQGSYVFRADRI